MSGTSPAGEEEEVPPLDHLEKGEEKEEAQDGGDSQEQQRPCYILPLIVCSQFAGTSLWFAGNAVLPDLVEDWEDDISISEEARGYLTSVVQFGFICGTLTSAILNLPDRFLPTKLFMWSALVGALFNAVIPFWKSTAGLILLRFGTGICLAGIYPVGMKVAADWYCSGLGRALGWLVGALAVGSALPFLLNQRNQRWQALLWETSGLACCGGLAIGCGIHDGPYRKQMAKFDISVIRTLFQVPRSLSRLFWSYVWSWCPVVWKAYIETQDGLDWDESAVTFAVLAMGGVGCVGGGLLSVSLGSANVAFVSLWVSGFLCFFSPALYMAPPYVMLIAYLIWGITVVADSPQFSSLVATYAPATNKGTALTIVNCLGFTITIGSIQLLGVPIPEQFLFLLLAPGPLLGLCAMRNLVYFGREKAKTNVTVEEDLQVE